MDLERRILLIVISIVIIASTTGAMITRGDIPFNLTIIILLALAMIFAQRIVMIISQGQTNIEYERSDDENKDEMKGEKK